MTQVRDDTGSEPGGGSALKVIRLDSGYVGKRSKAFQSRVVVEMLEAWTCHR